MSLPSLRSHSRITLASARQRFGSLVKRAKEEKEDVVEAALTVGGGAACGALRAKYPQAQVMGVNAPLVLGGLAVAADLMGWLGKHGKLAGSFGAGVLAGEAAFRTYDALRQ